MILLDTDILIDFFRGHTACHAWIISLGTQPVCVSVVTAMELFAGCRNKKEQRGLQQKLARYAALWPSDAEAVAMIPAFADAYLTHATGILDSLIAATALSHKLPLHTFNKKHFAAFPQLKTVQPYIH